MVKVVQSTSSLAFAGAGVVAPLGYPSWPALIQRLAEETRATVGEHLLDAQDRDITVQQALDIPDNPIAADIAPHDLRRTCAKLCRAGGGELEQIQLLLGHASVQTTERYLSTK